jgi:hypothetical protein
VPERPLEEFLPEAHPPDLAMESASEDSQGSASVSLLAALTKELQVLTALVLVLPGSRTAFRLVLL